ncbi:MAG: hypothetical protein IJM40_09330, partial [Synergistaceae bacterium]|nr:hypothetical protein [Synergistaceae bacterium]
IITLAMYGLASYYLVSVLCDGFKFKIKLLLTLIIVAVSLSLMEYMNETLYWLSAMHYVWTQAFLIFAFALALKALNGSKGAFILCLIILFLDGITLEQPVIFSGVAAFLAAIYYLYKGERQKFLICAAFWLACIAGFLVMYLAPGTAHRVAAIAANKVKFNANYTEPHGTQLILNLIKIAISGGVMTAGKFFSKPFIYVFILFTPCIAENIKIKFNLRLKVWQIILFVLMVDVGMNLITGATAGGALYSRTESIALCLMSGVWFALFGFCWRNEKILSRIKNFKIFKLRYALLILCLLAAPNFTYVIRDLKIAPEYVANNAARLESALSQHKAGVENVIVPYLDPKPKLLFVGDLVSYEDDIANWVNKSYAGYYGLNKITPVPKSILNDQDKIKRWLNGDISVVNTDEESDASFIYDIAVMYDAQSSMGKAAKDTDKAIKLYNKASQLGHNQANRSLARVYLTNPKYKNYLTGAYWLARYIIGSSFPFAI